MLVMVCYELRGTMKDTAPTRTIPTANIMQLCPSSMHTLT